MNTESAAGEQRSCALVVDLDGTLIRTDLLHESVFGLLRTNLLNVFRLPLWLLRGKAYMKQMIADRVSMRPELLPWQNEFLAFLRKEHERGRRLILATASNEKYAREIADHLGIFDDVLASDLHTNMSGATKLARVEELLGDEPFEYAGNAAIDFNIWRKSHGAVLVNPTAAVKRRADTLSTVSHIFEEKSRNLVKLLTAMRPHQWLKNLLLFVPLALSHQLHHLDQLWHTTLGFIAFCLCASSVYLLNDLLDLDADRLHPTKRNRPFAAGDLSIVIGVIAMGALLLGALLVSLFLPPWFFYVLVAYYLMTMAYSVSLKRAALLDGLVLAALYTLRLIAGAAAAEVEPSFWLLAFSMFVFLSLAFIKRYSELLLPQASTVS